MSTISTSISTIGRCVSSLIVGDEVFQRGDMAEGEIEDWLESLTTEQFKKVTEFFESMPKLKHSFTMKNTNTGKNFTMRTRRSGGFFLTAMMHVDLMTYYERIFAFKQYHQWSITRSR